MANMEIDVKRPEIQIKYIERKRSIELEDFQRECESWASTVFGRPYVDRDELSKLVYYMIPDRCEFSILMIAFKVMIFSSMYDDVVEKHPDRRDKWRNILAEKEGETNRDPIEAIFADIWRDIRHDLTENQKTRFIQVLVNHMSNLDKRESFVCGTPDEYFAFRYIDFGGDVLILALEYALKLKLDSSPLDHYLVRAFYENVIRYLTMVNDIASLKREYLEDGAKRNYVTLISRLHGCSFQEAVDFICKQLPIVESNILLYRDEIFAMKIPVEKKLIHEIIKAAHGEAYWYLTSIRYK